VYSIPEQDISKYFGDSNAGAAYLLYYQAADIDRAALGLHMPSPVEELGDVVSTNHALSQSTSPVQEIQPMLPIPRGPSLDTSNDLTARTKTENILLAPLRQSEEKQSLDDNHPGTSPLSANVAPESNPSSSHLTQPNGVISNKPSAGGFFTALRRSTSFSRPKTPNHDPGRKTGVQNQMPPFSPHSDASKMPPKSLKRPATSAGSLSHPDEKERESEKDKTRQETDSRPNWFRRRSFKGSDKARPMSAESLIVPPLPILDISGKTSASSPAKELAAVAPEPIGQVKQQPSEVSGRHALSNGTIDTKRPRSSAGFLDFGIHVDGHHSQRRPNEQASLSAGNSISSYGSSISHPPLPSTSAHSSSSSPTSPSSLSSYHQSSRTQSQIPNSLEHRKSMPESHGSKRKHSSRPLPPIPSLPPSASHDTVANGNVHEPTPGSPTRSTATTMSTTSHAKQSSSHHTFGPSLLGSEAKESLNAQMKRVGRKLSFTAPFLHFGRKDRDKHREKDMSSQVPSATRR
jgi:ubiquitin carboxyl-terminal hydrolase 9/13